MTYPALSDPAASSHIAVIGLSCRFPGAGDPGAFWKNLRQGHEAISFFSDQELLSSGIDANLLSHPNYVRAGAVLPDIDMFDATFFGFSPREAEILDPQHRLLLECAWEALEDAGYNPELDKGLCGVFAGAGVNTYLLHNLFGHSDLLASAGSYHLMLANDKDYLATRISYKLNLKGPSVTVQTACSTSLAAVHLACQSLLSGECDVALAGGVSVRVPHNAGYLYQEGMILSPDGHCRAFDASAQGTVGGNGAGLVVLKRLKDALTQGDYVRAVIRGSAINNDGSLKAGYTAPSVDGQAAVISEAMAVAGVDRDTITYIEAHGTGTPIGDPIELAALRKAFQAGTRMKRSCAIGSVKTNLGHLDAAAGVAGLIKTVLALENKEIPPSLHFERPNPEFDLENSPFYVNSALAEWKRGNGPRRAGVSSFGIGGTNVHVVLEEAPPRAAMCESRPCQLLVLSAKSEIALNAASARLGNYLSTHPEACLADVALTLSRRRTDFPYRRALVCKSTNDAVAILAGPTTGQVQSHETPAGPVVFMFPGQGSQYVNMGLELYNSEPTFRDLVDQCSEILERHLGLNLRDVLFPRAAWQSQAEQLLSQTSITQPALFVVEYALAMLWMEWGVRPQYMIGHSVGEYVAACLAGVFSLKDCLAIVAMRAKLMQQIPAGGMLAVSLPADRIQQRLNDDLTVAAVNTPSQCAISGDLNSIRVLCERLEQEGVECVPLKTSHAFHSHMMEPIVDSFASLVAGTERRPPKSPYVSNVTGTWITASEAIDPQYWARHLRQTVRFADGLQVLFRQGCNVLLEVGPGHVLGSMAKQFPDCQCDPTILCSMRQRGKQSDSAVMLESVGHLWLDNVPVDWSAVYKHQPRRHTPLPTYPFERQRYWLDPPSSVSHSTFDAATIKEDEHWFYLPSWRRCLSRAKLMDVPVPANCLLFIDELGYGEALAAEFRRKGASVTAVKVGSEFARLSEGLYTLNPTERDDYYALIRELSACGEVPEYIAHMWSITAAREQPLDPQIVDRANDLGFYSLMFLAQSFGDLRPAGRVKLAVVTNHLHDVTGQESLQPEKAMLLGPVAVIPQEYAHLTCKNIDIDVPEGASAEARLAHQLIGEVTGDYSDPVVSYRGRHRWVQAFVPARLEAPSDATVQTRLRDGGVYVIIGGTGGVGLALAESIAKSARSPTIALIGRSASDEPAAENAGFDLSAQAEHLARVEQGLHRTRDAPGTSGPNLQPLLDELCSSFVCEYFRRCGVRVTKGQTYSRSELLRKLRIIPKFEKFLYFFVRILEEDSILSTENGQIVFQKDSREIRSTAIISREATEKHPDVECIVNLLAHCATHYEQALTGDTEAISVLYPEGELSPLVTAVEEHGDKYNTRFIPMNLLGEVLSRIAHESGGRRARILEIGAGNGELTWRLLPRLRNIDVEYTVTDIGKSFVVNAEQRAAELDLNFMRFGVLDISIDPLAQGYEQSSFDVIVGLDVVHATPRVSPTLENLNVLLAPGGVLCLLETVREQRWTDMVFGLAEGWWYFEDYELRTRSPLISIRKWLDVLKARGYRHVTAYPRAESEWDRAEFGLLVAQTYSTPAARHHSRRLTALGRNEARSSDEKRRAIAKLGKLGATAVVLNADVGDADQMRAVLAEVRQEFGAIHGVIHAAGIAGGGTIQVKAREDAEKELASKVKGTLVLDSLLRDDALDFFVLCSSYTSVAGGFGQICYSAANAFLDAFARYRACHSTETFTTSIAWDRWRNVGMATAVEAIHEQLTNEALTGGLNRDEGMETFRRILSSGSHPNIIVYRRDFDALLKSVRSYQLQSFEDGRPTLPLHSRPELHNDYTPAKTEIERSIVDAWQQELGIRQVGIHDNFSELGGDSLIAIRLISRIRQSLGVELRVRTIYDSPTVAGLAEHVQTVRWVGQEAGLAVGATSENEESGSL
jgi:acyl transferase domain-containing protein/SAM-dependent methyltransferase/acyl carrier protein